MKSENRNFKFNRNKISLQISETPPTVRIDGVHDVRGGEARQTLAVALVSACVVEPAHLKIAEDCSVDC